MSLDQMDRAEEIFVEQERIARKHLGDDHPVTAESTRRLGWLLTVRDEDDRALPILQRALASFRSQEAFDEHAVVDTLTRIAEAQFDRGQFAEVVSAAKEALVLCENKAFAEHYASGLRVLVAMARWELGEQREDQVARVRTELVELEQSQHTAVVEECKEWLAARQPSAPSRG